MYTEGLECLRRRLEKERSVNKFTALIVARLKERMTDHQRQWIRPIRMRYLRFGGRQSTVYQPLRECLCKGRTIRKLIGGGGRSTKKIFAQGKIK